MVGMDWAGGDFHNPTGVEVETLEEHAVWLAPNLVGRLALQLL